MAAIRERDIPAGERAWQQWNDAAQRLREDGADSESLTPTLPRPTWAMAVRYTLYLLERKAPGPGVEVRVAPWGAVKILDGPASDPHNLTPPDVIELDPEVWLRLAAGITTWPQEKDAGRITAVGERDDLSDLLPLCPAAGARTYRPSGMGGTVGLPPMPTHDNASATRGAYSLT